jgi:hypothetical protein
MDRRLQTKLWIALAVVWWLSGLILWLVNWIIVRESYSSLVTLLSTIFILSISSLLRLPSVLRVLGASESEKHLVWLLCLGANVNWLGAMALCSGNVWWLVLIAGCGLLAEWLHYRQSAEGPEFWRSFFTATVRQAQSLAGRSAVPTAPMERTEDATAQQDRGIFGVVQEQAVAAECGTLDASPCQVRRTMQDGTDEDGHRYLSGEIFVDWQAGQRILNLTVAFVPAFAEVPRFEFEIDADLCEVRCIHCSQSGMRLTLRRKGQLDASQVCLAWYASQGEDNAESSTNRQKRMNSLA